jgi:hypothetical protein
LISGPVLEQMRTSDKRYLSMIRMDLVRQLGWTSWNPKTSPFGSGQSCHQVPPLKEIKACSGWWCQRPLPPFQTPCHSNHKCSWVAPQSWFLCHCCGVTQKSSFKRAKELQQSSNKTIKVQQNANSKKMILVLWVQVPLLASDCLAKYVLPLSNGGLNKMTHQSMCFGF